MRVLAAIDFSDCSAVACGWALRFAQRMVVDEIVFLHVLDAVAESEAGSSGRLGELERSIAATRAIVEEQTKVAIGAPLPESVVSYQTVRGEPADAILHAAESGHIDVIVVGTEGRTGIERFVLGSVAEAVVRRARCTVVTVKTGYPK